MGTNESKETESMSKTEIPTFSMRFRPLKARFHCIVIGLATLGIGHLNALAQDSHTHTPPQQIQEQTAEQKSQANALINIVRQSTERYKDVSAAEADGYALQFGCVSGSDSGAMGLHYVNGALVNRGELDPYHPQIVIYEPTADGSLKLIGADFLLFADAWDKKGQGPPELMGQLFHYFEAPNRFGLPAFYTLHVWAWKDNPNGAFVNWHPKVSCKQFNGQTR
jgi:hypothetical protein